MPIYENQTEFSLIPLKLDPKDWKEQLEEGLKIAKVWKNEYVIEKLSKILNNYTEFTELQKECEILDNSIKEKFNFNDNNETQIEVEESSCSLIKQRQFKVNLEESNFDKEKVLLQETNNNSFQPN